MREDVDKLYERLEEAEGALSLALRAICLTRDYVGEDLLPPIDGWEWYEAGKKIAEIIPKDEWAKQFALRINRDANK